MSSVCIVSQKILLQSKVLEVYLLLHYGSFGEEWLEAV